MKNTDSQTELDILMSLEVVENLDDGAGSENFISQRKLI